MGQWLIAPSLAAYSCGGSRGLGRIARTAFPFHPQPMVRLQALLAAPSIAGIGPVSKCRLPLAAAGC